MTSRSKAKGSAAERAVVTYLRDHGFPHAERRLAGHVQDRGDIAGMPGVVVEVKAHAQMNVAGWVDEAVLEQANDGADYGLVWHKRRGHTDAGQWYATLPAAQLVRLLRQAGYGEPLSASQRFQESSVGSEPGPDAYSPAQRPVARDPGDPGA